MTWASHGMGAGSAREIRRSLSVENAPASFNAISACSCSSDTSVRAESGTHRIPRPEGRTNHGNAALNAEHIRRSAIVVTGFPVQGHYSLGFPSFNALSTTFPAPSQHPILPQRPWSTGYGDGHTWEATWWCITARAGYGSLRVRVKVDSIVERGPLW